MVGAWIGFTNLKEAGACRLESLYWWGARLILKDVSLSEPHVTV